MTTLTMKEEKRLEVIQRVFRGELTVDGGDGDRSQRAAVLPDQRSDKKAGSEGEWYMGIGAGRVSARPSRMSGG
jgi:hypothetical protein